MSSIRVQSMTISAEDLKKIDKFMLSIGAKYYPGYNNKSEPSNMPWSTRWYIPNFYTLTEGRGKSSGYFTVELGQNIQNIFEAIR